MSNPADSHRSNPSLDLLESYGSDEDANSEFDENDIVLSPLWSRSRSQSMSFSASNSTNDNNSERYRGSVDRHYQASLAINGDDDDDDDDDQDLVLIVPGSSILSDSTTPSRSPTVLSTYSASASSSHHRSFDSNLLTSTPNTTMPSWFDERDFSNSRERSKMLGRSNEDNSFEYNEDDDESELDLIGALEEFRLSSSRLLASASSSSPAANRPEISKAAQKSKSFPSYPFTVFSEDTNVSTPRAASPIFDQPAAIITSSSQQTASTTLKNTTRSQRGGKRVSPRAIPDTPAINAYPQITTDPHSKLKSDHKAQGTAAKAPVPKEDPAPVTPLTKSQKRSAQRRRAAARLHEAQTAQQQAPARRPLATISNKETKKNATSAKSVLKPTQPITPLPSRNARTSKNISTASTVNAAPTATSDQIHPKRPRGKRGGRGRAKVSTSRSTHTQIHSTHETVYDDAADTIYEEEEELYKAAVKHMDSIIAHPQEDYTTLERLAIAQALLVELGLCTTASEIPKSVRAARTLLATHVHLNIIDYLKYHPKASPHSNPNPALKSDAHPKGKGQNPKSGNARTAAVAVAEKEKERKQAKEQLRASLFPSKKKLKEDLKKRKIGLKTAKLAGLRDLLVEGFWNQH